MHSGYTFRTRAILTAQRARGWYVMGVTGARHTASGPDVETVDGLTFHRTPAHQPAPTPLGEAREVAALAKRVEALVDDFKPDLLHAHSPVLTSCENRVPA